MTPPASAIVTLCDRGAFSNASVAQRRVLCENALRERSAGDFETLVVDASSNGAELETAPWFARVTANKYPALVQDDRVSEPTPRSFFDDAEGRFWRAGARDASNWNQEWLACGLHEVVVDSRRHLRGWEGFSPLEIQLTFLLFRARLRSLRADGRYEYAFFFKNVGANAGASQTHTHCQSVATPWTPRAAQIEFERVARYCREAASRGDRAGFWQTLIESELSANERVIYSSERFVVYCPFASRFPYQVEIVPRFDVDFDRLDDASLFEFADLSRATARTLQEASRRALSTCGASLDYNVILRATPLRLSESLEPARGYLRPRLVFLPSLVKKAGYEIGTQIDINPIAPETAARSLQALWRDL